METSSRAQVLPLWGVLRAVPQEGSVLDRAVPQGGSVPGRALPGAMEDREGSEPKRALPGASGVRGLENRPELFRAGGGPKWGVVRGWRGFSGRRPATAPLVPAKTGPLNFFKKTTQHRYMWSKVGICEGANAFFSRLG